MKIKKLKIRDFRNFESLEIEFGENIIVLLGENAQGKTNILESISFMSTTRSFRNLNEQQMIKEGKDFANIQIQWEDDEKKILSSIIHKEGKSFSLFQTPILKTSEVIGLLSSVIFTPNELEIFSNSPKYRRKMLDVEIGKVSKNYLFFLKKYTQLLKERNQYLKEEKIDDVYLETITEQLIEAMIPVVQFRKEIVLFLNDKLSDKLKGITKKENIVSVCYETNISEDKDKNLKLFKKNEEKDKLFKQTQLGVHRDDISFYLDNKEAINHASQGQKRMIVLSLKLTLIDYIEKMSGKKPVLLLDDVLSELDQKHRINLFESIPKEIQTIITTTDLDEFHDSLKGKMEIYEIKENKAYKSMEERK